jgi:hypothetical protein
MVPSRIEPTRSRPTRHGIETEEDHSADAHRPLHQRSVIPFQLGHQRHSRGYKTCKNQFGFVQRLRVDSLPSARALVRLGVAGLGGDAPSPSSADEPDAALCASFEPGSLVDESACLRNRFASGPGFRSCKVLGVLNRSRRVVPIYVSAIKRRSAYSLSSGHRASDNQSFFMKLLM